MLDLSRERLLANWGFVFALVVQLSLILVRTANLYVTGFLTSDEANYAIRAIDGVLFPNRYFFDAVTIGVFRVFGVDSASTFFAIFPFFIAFWSLAFLFVTYKVLRLLTDDRGARNFVMFSIPFIITYSLLSVGFLTETEGLTLCMVGIYCWIRYFKVKRNHILPLASGAALVASAYTREPYMIFPILGVFAWILLAGARRAELIDALLFAIPSVLLLVPNYSPFLPLVAGPLHILLAPAASQTTTVHVTTSGVGGIGGGASSTTTQSSAPSGFSAALLTTISNTAYLFVLGLILGWNPVLFAIGVAGFTITSYLFAKRRYSFSTFALVILGLGAFLILDLLFVTQIGFFTGQGLSTLLRYSNPSVPAYLVLASVVYERLNRNRRVVVAAILIVLVVASFGTYTRLSQTNLYLPYNVMDFSHPYGPMVARNYLVSNMHGSNTTVFVSFDWKAGQLYLADIPGLNVYPKFVNPQQLTDTQFESLHPTSYYILSAGPVTPGNTNLTISSLGLPNPPPAFITEAYQAVLNQTVTPADGFVITSAHLILNSPTGSMIQVTGKWE